MKEPLLLVDDEDDFLRALQRLFERDYEPLLASSPDEALRVMDSRPDCRLALIDLHIPKPEHGIALIRTIIAKYGAATAGYSAESRLEGEARAAGANTFVVKGSKEQAIRTAVDELPRRARGPNGIGAGVADAAEPARTGAGASAEDDYVWFLRQAAGKPEQAGRVVVLQNGAIVGEGSTHLTAWESVTRTAARAGRQVPAREEVVFVVVPPAPVFPSFATDD